MEEERRGGRREEKGVLRNVEFVEFMSLGLFVVLYCVILVFQKYGSPSKLLWFSSFLPICLTIPVGGAKEQFVGIRCACSIAAVVLSFCNVGYVCLRFVHVIGPWAKGGLRYFSIVRGGKGLGV